MRLANLFRRQVNGYPRTPIAIPFTMEDFAEIKAYAMVLANYGITWQVDALDIARPEVVIIYRREMVNFELWRNTAGLVLRCMDPKRDGGTIELRDQHRAWLLVCALTAPPIWLATDEEVTTDSRAMACLLKWLRA